VGVGALCHRASQPTAPPGLGCFWQDWRAQTARRNRPRKPELAALGPTHLFAGRRCWRPRQRASRQPGSCTACSPRQAGRVGPSSAGRSASSGRNSSDRAIHQAGPRVPRPGAGHFRPPLWPSSRLFRPREASPSVGRSLALSLLAAFVAAQREPMNVPYVAIVLATSVYVSLHMSISGPSSISCWLTICWPAELT